MMTWIMCASTDLLQSTIVSLWWGQEEFGGRQYSQSVSIFVRFQAYIEGDPPVGLLNGQNTDVLQIQVSRSCPDGDGGWRVRVIKREAEIHRDFLRDQPSQ